MDPFRRKYSDRLGTLGGEQLQAALDRFDLGRLVVARPAAAGLFGQNVLLESTRGRYVLRGCPHSEWQLDKERFFARLIHERTRVPSPWPYQIEHSSEIFGWPFAIMPRLSGEPIGDPDLRDSFSRAEQLELAGALGEGLGELHAIEWPHAGEFDLASGTIAPLAIDLADWILEQARERLARCCVASGATTSEDVAWILEELARGEGALREPLAPGYVHHDYTEGNTVATRDSSGWRLSGVFDLMEGYMGDPEADLVRSIAQLSLRNLECGRRFVAGYRSRRELRPGHLERFRVYMLIDRLVLWEYGQRNRVWFEQGTSFRDFARWFVELAVF